MADEVKNDETPKVNPFAEEVKSENAKREGVGLRVFTGYTRGRATAAIKWEAFDTDKPDTLPTSPKQFAEVTGITDSAKILSFMIDGFNEYQYRQASDPIAEFVNPAWDDDTKLKFRTVVRNYATVTSTSIEETVALMKPGVEKAFAAKVAAESANKPAEVPVADAPAE